MLNHFSKTDHIISLKPLYSSVFLTFTSSPRHKLQHGNVIRSRGRLLIKMHDELNQDNNVQRKLRVVLAVGSNTYVYSQALVTFEDLLKSLQKIQNLDNIHTK